MEEQGKLETRKNSQGEGCGGWGSERGRGEGGSSRDTRSFWGQIGEQRLEDREAQERDRGQEGRVPQVADTGRSRKTECGGQGWGQWMDKDIQESRKDR